MAMIFDDGCNDNEMMIRRVALEQCAKLLEAKVVEAGCCQGTRKGSFCDSFGCQTLLDLATQIRRIE